METRQERDSDQVEREKLQAAEESFAKEMALRSQELAEASEGTRQLGVLRERIQELWAVLESDAPDKLTFVMEVEASAAFSTAMLDLYQKEVVKLTDQLPLMETVT